MSAPLTARVTALVGLSVLLVVLVLLATAVAATLVDHATRLHRLHRRVDASAAALDQALARRRARSGAHDGGAHDGDGARAGGDSGATGAGGDQQLVAALAAAARGRDESALTRCLAAALPAPVPALLPVPAAVPLPAALTPVAAPVTWSTPALLPAPRPAPARSAELVELAAACEAVVMARRFANDAAARAARVRTKPLVRWARLAGSAPMPATVEMDDEVPPALAGPGGAW